jgi:GTPase Era involved in 16S rRNA processing
MKSFGDFADLRSEILNRCDELEVCWRQANAFSGDTEKFVGTSESSGPDLVEDTLTQIRQRLRSSVVEVGVFGQVKRGKSTLMNALVGQVVTSMRVTPETAVPVWIESGTGPSEVWKADGTIEIIDDPAAARERMGQKYRKAKPKDVVVRVVQYVNVDWMASGIRLIDTPGLSDPSLVDAYEDLTLAELDRVAAAIFVVVSPPGLDSEELRLLRSFQDKGVDKAFIVCNFLGGQWRNESDRKSVRNHILNAVSKGASERGVFLDDQVRIYELNAKEGLQAALEGDTEAYSEFGIEQLRSDLEFYLSEGVLTRLIGRSEDLLGKAKNVLIDRLDQRVQSLADRTSLEEAVLQHEKDLKQSERELEIITDDAEREISSIESELLEVMDKPFASARSQIESAGRTRDLDMFGNRLRMDCETAASRASHTMDSRFGSLEISVRKRLYDSFGVERRISLRNGDSVESGAYNISVEISGGKADWGAVAMSAGATAAAGGLVGGALAGGIGLALIAAGPVGWLIGAGIGLAAGALAGGVTAGVATRDSVQPAQRARIFEQVDRQRGEALDRVRSICAEAKRNLVRTIRDQRDVYFDSQRRELTKAVELRDDEIGRVKARDDAASLVAVIGKI